MHIPKRIFRNVNVVKNKITNTYVMDYGALAIKMARLGAGKFSQVNAEFSGFKKFFNE